MNRLQAIKASLEQQVLFQNGRDEEGLHDQYTEFFNEGIEFCLDVVEAHICAEDKAACDLDETDHVDAIIEGDCE